ncbi:hypothetical protein PRIPAC_95218 [Pristionchus pacificus]|uniref:Uncharacterized protein n=1 Tax=Pristionchus pacificus TaxID=54126 RepID=A0A2A6B357_PRIPA|nr:hypothetical protein PRIPAC_95218 [Pristionchus pacificus]|eukprot:PDM60293.1 hypothetical protein PRIPAC_54118 [Pristionchus pacificus]
MPENGLLNPAMVVSHIDDLSTQLGSNLVVFFCIQMSYAMFFLSLFLILPSTDAFIRLHKSVLYDEVDFKGVNQISTDMCTAGCKVVADLARRFVRDTQQEKDYVEIGRPAVNLDPYYRTAEVFEPVNLKRNKGIASAPITILSAYPFTVTVQKGDSNLVFARTTGYDAIDRNSADTCFTAMDNDFGGAFDGFSMAINGPLLTLVFDIDKYPHSAVELSASTDFKFELYPFPQQPTFISSPGFVCGCGSAPETYRSSAVSMGNAYTLHTPDDKEMVLNFDMDIDTIGGQPVLIYDHKTTLNHPFSGHFADMTNAEHVQLQTYRATVSFDAQAGGSFGMRVWAYDVGIEPAKTTSGFDATTSVVGYRSLTHFMLLTSSHASIRLQHSILYDEVDFKGVDQVTTHMCAAGCKVYATITGDESNMQIAGNIAIVDPSTEETTSILDLSLLFLQDSNKKSYLEIEGAQTLTIHNMNDNLESTPLALWIVSAYAPYYRTAEVYEPLNLNRTEAIASAPITILSADPFTGNGVFAKFAGYDAIDRNSQDNCYVAMDKDFGKSFAGLTFMVNSPLLTLSFDTAKYPHSQVALTGSSASASDFEITMVPEKPTFLSSPGFMCGGAAHQVYRSSALIGARGMTYTLLTPNDKEMKFNFATVMDTDFDHPVTIYDLKTTFYQSFSGNIHDRTSRVNLFLQTDDMVAVSFTLEDSDNFYEMRVWVDDESEVATKTTASPKEATTSAQESKATVAEKESTTTTNAQDSKTTVSGKDTTTSSTENPSLSMILLAIVAVILG